MLLIMSLIPGWGTQEPQAHVGNFPVKLQNLGIHLQGLLPWNLPPEKSTWWNFLELQVSQINILMDVNLNILVLILGSVLQALLGLGDAPEVSTNSSS